MSGGQKGRGDGGSGAGRAVARARSRAEGAVSQSKERLHCTIQRLSMEWRSGEGPGKEGTDWVRQEAQGLLETARLMPGGTQLPEPGDPVCEEAGPGAGHPSAHPDQQQPLPR